MNVRVPFQVPVKGMKDTDKSGCKIFGFIDFGKHAQNDIADRRKKKTEESAVLEEKMRNSSGMVKTQCLWTQETSLQDIWKERS